MTGLSNLHDGAGGITIKPAGSSRRAWTILALAVGVFLTADIASKVLAFATIGPQPVSIDRSEVITVMANNPRALQGLLPAHEPVTVVPGLLDLNLVLNAGAVFGAGTGRRWFFVGFTFVAMAFAVFMFARWTDRDDTPTHIAIALIVAGGLGNLYDRLAFACVRDFIHPLPGITLPFGWRWPIGGGREIWPYVSNVADALLLIGIGLAMYRLWTQDRRLARELSTGRDGDPARPGTNRI